MSYDLTTYAHTACDAARLAATFRAHFPDHGLEVLAWDADTAQLRVTLRAASKRPRAAHVERAVGIELARRSITHAPTLDVPKSSVAKLAGLRVAYTLSARTDDETAAAWVIAATLALALDGFVDDPQDGVTSTASHAKTRATRTVRGALTQRTRGGTNVDDDGPLPEHLDEERRSMFAASLRRHAEAGTFEAFIEGAVLDAELLRVGLAFSVDASRGDVSSALARRASPELLAAHALEASRAPGLRSRLYFEHLIHAGALDGLSPGALRDVLAGLASHREPELAALLRARRA